MNARTGRGRPVRLTLIWTEQALAARPGHEPSAAEISDDYPFDGPAFDADAGEMAALEAAGVLARLDTLPHEGMSLQDTHEEAWFDLDQLEGLIAAIESMRAENRATRSKDDEHLARWLDGALAFVREARELKRGVCFWL